MAATDDHRNWDEAYASELDSLRRHRQGDPENPDLVGLAFSGGGIRSATFGLGVLESLKGLGLLRGIDYLSTVSGGGYIGAWLSAGHKRHPDWLEPDANWVEAIRHLRRYSNYLSPEVGFFSADTWSMATIWLRNTLLVQLTVVLAIACALMLPRPLFELFQHWPAAGSLRWLTIVLFILGVVGIAGNQMRVTSGHPVALLRATSWPAGLAAAAACLAAAWMYARWTAFDPFPDGQVAYSAALPVALLLVAGGFLLQPVFVRITAAVWPNDDPPEGVNYTQNWVQAAVVVPLMTAAYLVAAILWGETTGAAGHGALSRIDSYGGFFTTAWRYWPFPLSVVFVSLWLLSAASVRSRRERASWAAACGAPVVAVLLMHGLLCAVMLLLHGWQTHPDGVRRAFVLGPPLVAGAFVLTIVILIGMMGRQSTDGAREWWSRLGAWLGIYATGWMVIALSAVYGPVLVRWAIEAHPWTALTAGGGWLGTVIAGLFAGNSGGTGSGETKGTRNKVKEVVAAVAPFVFIAGLLVGVAWVLEVVIAASAATNWPDARGLTAAGEHAAPHATFLTVSLWVWGACVAALLLMASRVDINEFSLNAFYRNRLARCYLGATRTRPGERNPQHFTGFDDEDDLALADLNTRPLHLVNCALNLGGSSDLALHTRHSAAFVLSPLHCGSGYKSRTQAGTASELGYVPTPRYGGESSAPTLGQAISVSGAAASPNMGYHTSPVVAFLLTLFNVRLGWWFPNPGRPGVKRPSPRFNLRYLLAELFGGANDSSGFVMISDGGHFENLAAYELIRRRCRVMIISDGECDPALTFGGLGTLIRMCEVDFGVRIAIDVSSIRAEREWSSRRWAVGRIVYGNGVPDGVLVYLKASMTGLENTSVLQYKSSHPAFPHESTGDQFYGEDQFESYRHLGREIALEAFHDATSEPDVLRVATRMLAREAPDLEAT